MAGQKRHPDGGAAGCGIGNGSPTAAGACGTMMKRKISGVHMAPFTIWGQLVRPTKPANEKALPPTIEAKYPRLSSRQWTLLSIGGVSTLVISWALKVFVLGN